MVWLHTRPVARLFIVRRLFVRVFKKKREIGTRGGLYRKDSFIIYNIDYALKRIQYATQHSILFSGGSYHVEHIEQVPAVAQKRMQRPKLRRDVRDFGQVKQNHGVERELKDQQHHLSEGFRALLPADRGGRGYKEFRPASLSPTPPLSPH